MSGGTVTHRRERLTIPGRGSDRSGSRHRSRSVVSGWTLHGIRTDLPHFLLVMLHQGMPCARTRRRQGERRAPADRNGPVHSGVVTSTPSSRAVRCTIRPPPRPRARAGRRCRGPPHAARHHAVPSGRVDVLEGPAGWRWGAGRGQERAGLTSVRSTHEQPRRRRLDRPRHPARHRRSMRHPDQDRGLVQASEGRDRRRVTDELVDRARQPVLQCEVEDLGVVEGAAVPGGRHSSG